MIAFLRLVTCDLYDKTSRHLFTEKIKDDIMRLGMDGSGKHSLYVCPRGSMPSMRVSMAEECKSLGELSPAFSSRFGS